MNGLLSTGFSYFSNPKINVYLPGKDQPIIITSATLKMDMRRGDFMFVDDVVMKTKDGVLKTNFLYFNPKKMELRSFDKFSYNTKNKTYHGAMIHGLVSQKKITLFNISTNHKKKTSLDIQL